MATALVYGAVSSTSQSSSKVNDADLHALFVLPDGNVMEYSLSSKSNVEYLKRLVAWLAQGYGFGALSTSNGGAVNLAFDLKIPGADFLTNEEELLCSIPYVSSAKQRRSRVIFLVLPRNSSVSKKMKQDDVNIGYLIGKTMRWTAKDEEVTDFRVNMSRERFLERLNVALAGKKSHIPMTLLPHPVSLPNNSAVVTLFVSSANPTKKVTVSSLETADQLMERVFPLYLKAGRVNSGSLPRDYVFKPLQLSEYITGPNPFFQFKYSADCVTSGQQIYLDIIERSKVEVLSSSSSGGVGAGVNDLEDYVWSINNQDVASPRYDHLEIAAAAQKRWNSLSVISLWDLTNRAFRFRLCGLEGLLKSIDSSVVIQVDLFEGTTSLLPQQQPLITSPMTLTDGSCQWINEWIDSKIPLAHLPRATTLSLTVFSDQGSASGRNTLKLTPIAWVNVPLFDHKHELRRGTISMTMWPCVDNDVRAPGSRQSRPNFAATAPTITIRLETFALPVVFPTEPINCTPFPAATAMSPEESKQVERIASSAPLEPLTAYDKSLLWRVRNLIRAQPKMLAKLVQSLPRCDYRARLELYRTMRLWTPLDAHDALELLSASCADPVVRSYAVSRLGSLSDDKLLDILLQLVQALKFEPYLNCELARFLLRRALRSKLIGHFLYWHLKAEIHSDECAERNGLMLEAFLRGAGADQCEQLKKQEYLHQQLVQISSRVRATDTASRDAVLKEELAKIHATAFASPVQLPLDPFVEVTGLIIPKCRVMSSKQAPLWLVFQHQDSATGGGKPVLFKAGDDLRQDMLTVQMFKIMDSIWKDAGLNLEMSAYKVLATGNRVGFVEVVPRATTLCKVHDSLSGITGAFKEELLANWIQQKNPTKDMLAAAVARFVRSCAGYCVATYVLGIGDRHSDNVMIQDEGRLVHIDFGHILGNFKEKFGIKRERVPFVFTPDMAYAMGGKDSEFYDEFVRLGCKAYSLLRSHAHFLVNMFTMMLGSGLPELQTADDVSYMVDMFRLPLNDASAQADFIDQIESTIASSNTRMLWFFHSIAQRIK